MKGLKVANLISNSNFIGQMDLRMAGITPSDMRDFLLENNLTWSVMELGQWLGSVAFFYDRLSTDESTHKENPEDATPLTGEELLEIKARYTKKD